MVTKPTYPAENGPEWDWETLYRYLREDLPQEDIDAISAEIEKDPLLADTVEGLRHIKDVKQLKNRLERIRTRSHARLSPQREMLLRETLSKRQSRIRPFLYPQMTIGIAAGLILLIVGVWTIRKSRTDAEPPAMQELITDASPPPPAEAIPTPKPPVPATKEPADQMSTREAIPLPDQITSTAPDERPRAIEPSPAKPAIQPDAVRKEEERRLGEEVDSEVAQGIAKPVPTQSSVVPPTIPIGNEPQAASGEEEIAAANVSTTEDLALDDLASVPVVDSVVIGASSEAGYAEVGEPINQKQSRKRDKIAEYDDYYESEEKAASSQVGKLSKARAISEVVMEGKAAFEQENYRAASDLFGEVLLSEPDNLVARYYQGRIQLAQLAYKEAIKSWKPILKHPDAPVYDATKFYLAQAYLETGRKKVAIGYWQDLSVGTGEFAVPSQEKLSLYRN